MKEIINISQVVLLFILFCTKEICLFFPLNNVATRTVEKYGKNWSDFLEVCDGIKATEPSDKHLVINDLCLQVRVVILSFQTKT